LARAEPNDDEGRARALDDVDGVADGESRCDNDDRLLPPLLLPWPLDAPVLGVLPLP
jgi:hypothetical protein